MQDVALVFAPWTNFYVIIGSSAAALTGLMFVVVTLAAGNQRSNTSIGFAAFSTPTVVHFCAAFLIAGTLSAPWRSLATPVVLIFLIGVCGIVYDVRVIYLTRQLNQYQLMFDDWIWFAIVPLLNDLAITATAALLPKDPAAMLFPLGGATISLIVVGIRNAWDVVTFLALDRGND
jgi:hypothetical protein